MIYQTSIDDALNNLAKAMQPLHESGDKTRSTVADAVKAMKAVPSFSDIVRAANEADCPPEKLDTSQWGSQLKSVYEVTKDGRWRSLAEIAFHAKAPEASVSARLRDLRRKGLDVQKRKAREGGLYEYRLIADSLQQSQP
jgi:hypothetical protein